MEDEFFLADDLARILRGEGAEIIGPAATVAQTTNIIRDHQQINAAIVDLNLRGEISFEIADMLIARGIPFIFVTGYDTSIVPDRLKHIVRYEKPINAPVLAGHISALLTKPAA